MPYYNRAEQLYNTLKSFSELYDSEMYEVVIIEDAKSNHNELMIVLDKFFDKMFITHSRITEIVYSPVTAFNKAVELAKGEYFIITNPECCHEQDILNGLEIGKNDYIVCACANKAYIGGKVNDWYQHSKYRNKSYHFCSALSRENWVKVGGFDEDYKYGIAYDDDDFVQRVKKAKLKICLRDDLVVTHQQHRIVWKDKNLIEKNKQLFKSKWKT